VPALCDSELYQLAVGFYSLTRTVSLSVKGSFDFSLCSCVWIVVGTRPGLTLELPD
jgi:hypothetical protein